MATYDDLESIPPQRLVRNRLARTAWTGAGLLCTGLGTVGVVLPLVPTTPFVLLAAFCFARSSPRFYGWLLRNRAFGPLVRDWRAGRGIPLHAKVLAVTLLALTLGSSLVLVVSSPVVRVVLAGVGVWVAWFVLSRPTAPRRSRRASAVRPGAGGRVVAPTPAARRAAVPPADG